LKIDFSLRPTLHFSYLCFILFSNYVGIIQHTLSFKDSMMKKDDNDLAAEVDDLLKWDSRIDTSRVLVSVNKSIVTLEGFADSIAAREIAEADVWSLTEVIGVNNYIEINGNESNQFSDKEISTRVTSVYDWDANLSESGISVDVESGTVILSGHVSSLCRKIYAEDLISNMLGIKEIVNNIEVENNQSLRQMDVADHLIANLEQLNEEESNEVSVSMDGYVATLSGTVEDWDSWRIAMEVANSVAGVERVRDNLAIKTNWSKIRSRG